MLIEKLVTALGDRHYEIDRPFGLTEEFLGGGRLSDVDVSEDDVVYALSRFDRYVDRVGQPTVTAITPMGEILRTFTLSEVTDSHGISAAPGGRLLLTDRDRHEVRVLDTDGKTVMVLGERNRPGKPFNHPCAANVGPGGDIFVADGYGNSHVHRFSAGGTLLRSWGTPGTGPGEFSTPHDVCFGRDGEVIVTDRENNRVQIFDVDGTFIRQIGDLFHPMAVVVDDEGCIIVSDQIPRISRYTVKGELVGRGRPAMYGGHGMAIDRSGNLYFSEINVNRLTKLTRIS